jgi:hypothetical protein
MAASWDVHRSGDSDAEDFAAEVRLGLSELTSGHRTEEDFRGLLAELWRDSWAQSLKGKEAKEAVMDAKTEQSSAAGTPHEVVFG